jgi:hypothetical protein
VLLVLAAGIILLFVGLNGTLFLSTTTCSTTAAFTEAAKANTAMSNVQREMLLLLNGTAAATDAAGFHAAELRWSLVQRQFGLLERAADLTGSSGSTALADGFARRFVARSRRSGDSRTVVAFVAALLQTLVA